MADFSYHVNPATGNPRICTAKLACPFGGEEAHFGTREEAGKAYEYAMTLMGSSFAVGDPRKKVSPVEALEDAARSLTHAGKNELVTDGDRVFRMQYAGHHDGVHVTEINPSGIAVGSVYLDAEAMKGYRVVSSDEANAVMLPKVAPGFDLKNPHGLFAARPAVGKEARPGDVYVRDGLPHVVMEVKREGRAFGVRGYYIAKIDEFGVRGHQKEFVEVGSHNFKALTPEEQETFIARFNGENEDSWTKELNPDYPRVEDIERSIHEYSLAVETQVTVENAPSLTKAIRHRVHILDRMYSKVTGNTQEERLEALRLRSEILDAQEADLNVDVALRNVVPRRERKKYPLQPEAFAGIRAEREKLAKARDRILKTY